MALAGAAYDTEGWRVMNLPAWAEYAPCHLWRVIGVQRWDASQPTDAPRNTLNEFLWRDVPITLGYTRLWLSMRMTPTSIAWRDAWVIDLPPIEYTIQPGDNLMVYNNAEDEYPIGFAMNGGVPLPVVLDRRMGDQGELVIAKGDDTHE